MDSFGDIIRKLRQDNHLPLRKVAAFLDIDQAILSKIERGQRKASREFVVKLAGYFNKDMNELLIAWMSDNLVYQVRDEEMAMKALQAAQEKVAYRRAEKEGRAAVIKIIREFLEKDGRVSKAWLFGSFARNEETNSSDIDLMITYSDKASGTLFDYADIKFNLENRLHRRIDLAEEGYIQSFAMESINQEKIQIYG